MQELVSVIVPVYNMEQYLDKCVDSIIRQSYANLEIILVDDGATDRSGEMCDVYAEKHHQIKVLHKENGGLVSARKAGLKKSNGNYVMYVDSDDWIDYSMVSGMMELMIRYDCDIVQSCYLVNDNGREEVIDPVVHSGYYDLSDGTSVIFQNLFMQNKSFTARGIRSNLCGCIFKKEIIYDAQMNVPNTMTNGEDDACFFPAILGAKSFYRLDSAFYHIRLRNDSMTKTASLYSLDEIITLERIMRPAIENHHSFHVLKDGFNNYLFCRLNHITGMRWNIMHHGVYLLPYHLLRHAERVLVYGAGNVGKSYVMQIDESRCVYLAGWIDQNNGYSLYGHKIEDISAVHRGNYDVVIIAVANKMISDEIFDDLLRQGVSKDKIIWEKPVLSNRMFYYGPLVYQRAE